MKQFFQKNILLIIAFALPIIFVILVALSLYIPSLLLETQYNFVYASCTDSNNYYPYNCKSYLSERYSIIDQKLVVHDIDTTQYVDPKNNEYLKRLYDDHIFFYDTQMNESREITLEEAKNLTLSELITSPDGVSVSGNYSYHGNDFFFFGGGSSSYAYFLTKGNKHRKVNIVQDDNSYYDGNNFQFIGWILPTKN